MLRPWKFALPMLAALNLGACAQDGAEEAAEEMADTTAMEDEGISFADLVGTWNMETTNTDPADTFVNRYQIVIDETGWTLLFPDREPVVSTVEIEGDHINTTQTFESVRRPGTMVTTNTVFRLEGDRLVGDVTARWETTDADSVGHLRTEGTRVP